MIEQTEGSLMTRVNKVISDLEVFKAQTKKEKIDPSDFLTDSDLQIQVDNLRREIKQAASQAGKNTGS